MNWLKNILKRAEQVKLAKIYSAEHEIKHEMQEMQFLHAVHCFSFNNFYN